MKALLLGTTNPAKVHFVRAAFQSLPLNIVTPNDLGLQLDVPEDGRSTAENAERKAKAYFAAARMPTLAIDGGLHIEGLSAEKQLGVFVRRIHGRDRDATDEEMPDYYARELESLGGESVGLWEGAQVLVVSSGEIFVDTFSFKAILMSRRKGSVACDTPLDALTMDLTTGRYYGDGLDRAARRPVDIRVPEATPRRVVRQGSQPCKEGTQTERHTEAKTVVAAQAVGVHEGLARLARGPTCILSPARRSPAGGRWLW